MEAESYKLTGEEEEEEGLQLSDSLMEAGSYK
jgi:hypothetical protein